MGLTIAHFIEQLEALYASLPTVACKKLCAASCGPILMSGLEYARWAPRLPEGWRFDAFCPMLDRQTGLCTCYDVRPMICRLWGLGTDGFKCQYGCEPERVLEPDEVRDWLRRAEDLSDLACATIPEATPRDVVYLEQAEAALRMVRFSIDKRLKWWSA